MLARHQRPIPARTVLARAALTDGGLAHAAHEMAIRSAEGQGLPVQVADPAALAAVAVIIARTPQRLRARPASPSVPTAACR